MSTWRDHGDPCPLDEQPATMDKCSPCRFFRGASSRPGDRGYRHFACNWPRNGSSIEWPEIPQAFIEGMK